MILEVAEAAAMVEDPHDNWQGAPYVKGRVGILFAENYYRSNVDQKQQ